MTTCYDCNHPIGLAYVDTEATGDDFSRCKTCYDRKCRQQACKESLHEAALKIRGKYLT